MSESAPLRSEELNDAQTAAFDDSALLPGDTYLEGPYLVFTEQYHLRRGYCCNSDCRHCPYRAG